MMLRVTVFNQAGDTVNIQNIELSPEEREQRYKVIDLSPSCVNYKVEMYIDRGTSPLPTVARLPSRHTMRLNHTTSPSAQLATGTNSARR